MFGTNADKNIHIFSILMLSYYLLIDVFLIPWSDPWLARLVHVIICKLCLKVQTMMMIYFSFDFHNLHSKRGV